jgi:hypothetical protein
MLPPGRNDGDPTVTADLKHGLLSKGNVPTKDTIRGRVLQSERRIGIGNGSSPQVLGRFEEPYPVATVEE